MRNRGNCGAELLCLQIGAIGPRGPQGTAGGANQKAGIVTPELFAGAPLTYAVVFATPFPDTSYVIALSAVDSRMFNYTAKTANGFTINANSDAALTGEVSWTATGAMNP